MDKPSNPLDLLEKISLQLARIAGALEILAQSGRPAAPNYTRPIEEYSSFDWSTINAQIVQADQDGPTHLSWGSETWTRRSPQNKFSPAVWYSRAAGRDDDGNVLYLRLITFKQLSDSDPLPAGVHKELARPAASVSTETVDSPKKEEKAKSSIPPSSSGSEEKPKHGRPPGQVKENIQQLAGKMDGKVASDTQKGTIIAVLEGAFKGQEDQVGARRKVCVYLTGHDSLKTMPSNFILALHMWLKPFKGQDKEWHAGLFADEEARAIFAEIGKQS